MPRQTQQPIGQPVAEAFIAYLSTVRRAMAGDEVRKIAPHPVFILPHTEMNHVAYQVGAMPFLDDEGSILAVHLPATSDLYAHLVVSSVVTHTLMTQNDIHLLVTMKQIIMESVTMGTYEAHLLHGSHVHGFWKSTHTQSAGPRRTPRETRPPSRPTQPPR